MKVKEGHYLTTEKHEYVDLPEFIIGKKFQFCEICGKVRKFTLKQRILNEMVIKSDKK